MISCIIILINEIFYIVIKLWLNRDLIDTMYWTSLKMYQMHFFVIQWNLVIKRSDITKPSYNKVILLVPALYIS